MDLRLSFRDLEAADLSDLNWSGGPDHIRAVAAALEASYAGEVVLLVGSLPNDRLIAMGNVAGDLLWTFDKAAHGHSLQNHMWGRLRRA
jgi:hypothetical protein